MFPNQDDTKKKDRIKKELIKDDSGNVSDSSGISDTGLIKPDFLRPDFLTNTRFDGFDLPGALNSGITDAGFTCCTPIQAEVLPIALAGRDVAGQAQTGTGKTAAFLVTIFSRLIPVLSGKKRKLPSALIVAPTRELASQIHEETLLLGRHTDLKAVLVVGGVDYEKQAKILKKGVDIVVATPGRIIDYYKQKVFRTPEIQIVVIDEADRLLDMGFQQDMRFILKNLPHYEKRQSMLFSATLSYSVMELTYEYMNLPEFVAVAPDEITVDSIEQSLFHVENSKKLSLLLGLLNREKWTRALIFVNTRAGVNWLAQKLKGNGFPAEAISGDLSQPKRFHLMEKFKKAEIKILVATDVASRGIHVEDISHVINYDLPQDPEDYIHRIGRTARAGKDGKALSLGCETYAYHLEAIEEKLGKKIPVVWHEEEWLAADRCGPVKVPFKAKKEKAASRRQKSRPVFPASRKRKPVVKRDPDYFPGTFFGFGPKTETTKKSTEKNNRTRANPGKIKTDKAKRRKNPPRKKRDKTDSS